MSAHQAIATRFVWSSDSRYLAIQGMGAVRIVDQQARVVADLGGTKAVACSDTAPEFLIADKSGLERFHPASGKFVAAAVPWQTGSPELLGPAPADPRPRRYPLRRGLSLYGSMPMLPLGGGIVFAGDWATLGRARSPWVGPDGTVRKSPRSCLSDGSILSYGCAAAVRDHERDRAWFGERPDSTSCMGGGDPNRGVVRVVDAIGEEIAALPYGPAVAWLAPTVDGKRILVGLGDGTIVDVDADSLEERGRSRNAVAVPWLAALSEENGIALAPGGKRLWFAALPNRDQPLRLRTPIDLPAGMASAHLAALAPDRVHLALASDSAVRIVKIVDRSAR